MPDQHSDIIVRLKEHSRFLREAAAERRAIAGFGDAADKANRKAGAMSRSFKSAGGVAGDFFQRLKFMFSVGAVSAFAVGADAALSFEDQMAKVLAITDVNDQQFTALKNSAKDLGAQTRFSATEAAEGMYYLAAAGTDANKLAEVLTGTLDLAAATGFDVAESAKLQTTVLASWANEGETATTVADKMTVATNESKVQMDDLAISMKYVAAMSELSGQSLNDTLAAVMSLAEGGQLGSQAGTGLASGMTNLLAPTPKATKMLKKMGIEVEDLLGPHGLKPLSEVQGILAEGLLTLEENQRAAAVATIFGKNAMDAWGVLLRDDAPLLSEYVTLLEKAGGESERQADVMNNTTRGALERLKGSWESLAITFHERYDRDIKFAINKATDLIDDFRLRGTAAFGEYQDEVDQFTGGIEDLWDVITNDFIPVWEDLYEVIDDALSPLDIFTESVEFLKDHPFFTQNFFVPAITGIILLRFWILLLNRAIIGLILRLAILGAVWVIAFVVGLLIGFGVIALIIVVILLFVAAVILAWIYVDEFRNACENLFNFLADTWWGRILMFLGGPMLLLIELIILAIANYETMIAAFETVIGNPFMWIYEKFAWVIEKIIDLWNSTVGNLEFSIMGVDINIPEMAAATLTPFGAAYNELRNPGEGPVGQILTDRTTWGHVKSAGEWLIRDPDGNTSDDRLPGLYNPVTNVEVYIDGNKVTNAVLDRVEDRRARGMSRSGGFRG